MTEAIIITAGDPAGIGPEVVLKALCRLGDEERGNVEIVGSRTVMEACNASLGLPFTFVDEPGPRAGSHAITLHDIRIPGADVALGKVDARAGDAAYRYIVKAVDLIRERPLAILATAPLNKEALNAAGHVFDGHTGLLTHLCGAPGSFMLLTSERLSTIHVSTHVSLRGAIAAVTFERVLATIEAAHDHFARLGKAPRIAVAGLNPHAGEHGLFGDEDEIVVTRAIAHACRKGMDVSGPFPAHTIFRRAYDGAFDVVVAHYHDQGHIPMAFAAPETTINVSLGLPLDRVSVDHGTAFDIAGQGRANAANMTAVLRYATRLSLRPRAKSVMRDVSAAGSLERIAS